jgi:predicted metalloprotease with PDZ domain
MRILVHLLVSLLASMPLCAQLRYEIRYTDSAHPVIQVTITPASPLADCPDLIIPRSFPGGYSVVKYDHFVREPHAIDLQGMVHALAKNSGDGPRWSLPDKSLAVAAVSYSVDMADMERELYKTVDASSILRPGFAGLLNYSFLGWLEGHDNESLSCTVITFPDWPIFTTLAPSAKPSTSSLNFEAKDYYELADAQLFLGPAFRVKTYAADVPLYVVAYLEGGEEYLEDYAWQEIRSLGILKYYFGSLPFPEYSLVLRKAVPLKGLPQFPFAMEHLKSSTFFGDTVGVRRGPMTDDMRLRSMSTFLHHMGHAFIPLRCYGDAYIPRVAEIPPIINNIWFNEGFMWYMCYDTLKLPSMMDRFRKAVYDAPPAIRNLSLAQLSQVASTQYAEDFRLGSGIYSRGALMADEMNRYIKDRTGGKKSIREVYRFLYQWSQRNHRAFRMEEFPGLLKEATGVDLGAIYAKWLKPISSQQ